MQRSVILGVSHKIEAVITPEEKGAIMHHPHLENWFRVQAERKIWGKDWRYPG